MRHQQYIPRIVNELKKASPEKIILFGSYAYGTPNNDSDIDILVIKNIGESEVRNFRVDLRMKLWDIIKKWNIPIDIIVDSQQRIDERIESGDQFYKEIFTKGNILYG
ncbi:MAG: nucleotidyltransferase domain-containing protein [Prolixibacteraceae bacterium]|nr:nucleotidyltransferase domain-containing protein [Prolixibacteraceae bacterium]